MSETTPLDNDEKDYITHYLEEEPDYERMLRGLDLVTSHFSLSCGHPRGDITLCEKIIIGNRQYLICGNCAKDPSTKQKFILSKEPYTQHCIGKQRK
jgi:hypothetical protein